MNRERPAPKKRKGAERIQKAELGRKSPVSGRVGVTMLTGTPTRPEKVVIERKDRGAKQHWIPALALPPGPPLLPLWSGASCRRWEGFNQHVMPARSYALALGA